MKSSLVLVDSLPQMWMKSGRPWINHSHIIWLTTYQTDRLVGSLDTDNAKMWKPTTYPCVKFLSMILFTGKFLHIRKSKSYLILIHNRTWEKVQSWYGQNICLQHLRLKSQQLCFKYNGKQVEESLILLRKDSNSFPYWLPFGWI